MPEYSARKSHDWVIGHRIAGYKRSHLKTATFALTTPLLQLVTLKTLGRIKKGKCEGSIAEKTKEDGI